MSTIWAVFRCANRRDNVLISESWVRCVLPARNESERYGQAARIRKRPEGDETEWEPRHERDKKLCH